MKFPPGQGLLLSELDLLKSLPDGEDTLMLTWTGDISPIYGLYYTIADACVGEGKLMEGCRPLPNTQHSAVGDVETLSLCSLGASPLRAQHSHSPV